MENNIDISINNGYINHKELLITPEEANNLKPGEVTITAKIGTVQSKINVSIK